MFVSFSTYIVFGNQVAKMSFNVCILCICVSEYQYINLGILLEQYWY